MDETITFSLDGVEVHARAGETLLQVAQREGREIAHLCWWPGHEPAGNCRACVVEIEGERALAASCSRKPVAGMKVHSQSQRARKSQAMVLELLQSDMPKDALTANDELRYWAKKLHVGEPRFAPRAAIAQDASHPAMRVDLSACIACTRCLRACRDEQVNDVIGLAHRGASVQIVFDMDDPMGASTCVACGECVQACPTGALLPASMAKPLTTSTQTS